MSGGTDRSDPRRRRLASCYDCNYCLLPADGVISQPRATCSTHHCSLCSTVEHQCVNHFALGWTLLTPSIGICIPHEARRHSDGGSHSARARPVFSATGPRLDLDQILSSTVRARVTLSGFDTQGTTAPNDAPCRSRQEATWSNFGFIDVSVLL